MAPGVLLSEAAKFNILVCSTALVRSFVVDVKTIFLCYFILEFFKESTFQKLLSG